MKTAVCLVVRNEAVELPYWIAWQWHVGFDTVIIYDDQSTDATSAAIASIAREYDVRLTRIQPSKDYHAVRQVQAYNDAVARFGKEFDWIAFFDVDEYLDLYGRTLSELLAGLPEADCIAFSWCCYSTDGHVSRPAGAPVLNYSRHGGSEAFWNRHTKVMVRPQRLTRPLLQVHNADVAGATIDPAGRPVTFTTEHGGFLQDPPDWHGGRLVHLQSRSLEHYVKRDHHLEDLRRGEGDPLHNVTKNAEYAAHQTRLDPPAADAYLDVMAWQTEAQLRGIEASLLAAPEGVDVALAQLGQPPAVPTFTSSRTPHDYEISSGWISTQGEAPVCAWGVLESNAPYALVQIVDHFGHTIGVRGNQVVADGADVPLLALVVRGAPRVFFLTSDLRRLNVATDPRPSAILAYETWSNQDGTLSLGHPRTERLMGTTPDGNLAVNKKRAHEWERFTFARVENAEADVVGEVDIGALARYLASATSLAAIRRLSVERSAPDAAIGAAICSLSPAERRALHVITGDVLTEHLF